MTAFEPIEKTSMKRVNNFTFALFITALISILLFVILSISKEIIIVFFVTLLLWFALIPRTLERIQSSWIRFWSIIAKVSNPLFLGVIFFLIFTPFSLLQKVARRDRLKVSHFKNPKRGDIDTYWVRTNQKYDESYFKEA